MTGTAIGAANEIRDGETRTAVVPMVAAQLLQDGFRVLVESGAGAACGRGCFGDARGGL
jgi:NAD/NADP transhydrogenase alpha subunit